MPDVLPSHRLLATKCPIASDWRSPFVGKSIEDAANFVRNAPKPPKPLNKTWFAVMEKEDSEEGIVITLCKILSVGGELGLNETEQARTEEFRQSEMSLMCKIKSDKQQKIDEDKVNVEGEFEVQMTTMETSELGPWIGSDDSRYWWLH